MLQRIACRSSPGKQARRALAQHLRMKSGADIGEIERHSALAGRVGDGVAVLDEASDVSDRVEDSKAGADTVGSEGLIEVATPGRVDRHQGQVASIARLAPAARNARPPPGHRLGTPRDRLRELDGDVQVTTNARETLLEDSV